MVTVIQTMPIVPPQVMEEVVSERESQNIGTQSTARNTLTVVESASKIEERIADSSDEVPKPQKPFQAQLALHDVESQSTDLIQLALGRGSLVVAESGESDQLNLPSTFKETSSNLTIESIELPQRGCESVSENLNGQSQAVPTNLFQFKALAYLAVYIGWHSNCITSGTAKGKTILEVTIGAAGKVTSTIMS
jgi:hypothetical protein